MNTEEFRDLLQANAQAPRPVNPARTNQIEHRIKRRKTQRKVLTGFTAAAVAIAITGVWAETRDVPHSPTLGSVTPTQNPTLAEEFVAKDGAVYHRVSLTSLDWPRQKTATVPLVRNGKPLAARVACAGKKDVSELMYHFSTASQQNFNLLSGKAGMFCEPLNADHPFDLPDSLTSFTVSADKPHDYGTVIPDGTAAWTIALYEWTPPAKPKPAPPAPKMIVSENNPLVVKKGVWPKTQELTLTVPYRGRPLMYNAFCAGAIGGNARVEVHVNGRLNPAYDDNQCYAAEEGNVADIDLIRPPRGTKQVTLTVRLTGFDPGYLKRPGSWSVGVFEVKNP